MNNRKMTKDPTSRPITVLLFHGCVWPPYCKARIYEMIRPIIKAAPTKSICSIFSLNVASAGFALAGVLKKRKTITAASPPIGRLM